MDVTLLTRGYLSIVLFFWFPSWRVSFKTWQEKAVDKGIAHDVERECKFVHFSCKLEFLDHRTQWIHLIKKLMKTFNIMSQVC